MLDKWGWTWSHKSQPFVEGFGQNVQLHSGEVGVGCGTEVANGLEEDGAEARVAE